MKSREHARFALNEPASSGSAHRSRPGVGSPRDLVRRASNPRFAILTLVTLTYVWRFQELHPLLTASRITIVATLGLWLFLVLQPRIDLLRRASRVVSLPLMMVFIIWMAAAGPFGIDPAKSWDDWTGFHFKTLAMMLFVASSVSSVDSVKRIMALHIVGASVLAAFYVKGGFGLWGSPVTTYDVNDFALHLNMCVPLILYFIIASRRNDVRLALWILVGVFAVCILMTQSRGGFLTLGMLGLVAMVRMQGVRIWVRAMPFVLLIATYPLLPDATRARLSTLFSPQSDYNVQSEEGRIEIWKRGLGYLYSNPVVGVGVGNFVLADATLSDRAKRSIVGGQVTHNSFLEVAAETGFPGFFLYSTSLAIALFAAFRLASGLARRPDPASKDAGAVAFALALSMFSFWIGGFFLSMAHMQLLMMHVATTSGLHAAVSSQRGGPSMAVS